MNVTYIMTIKLTPQKVHFHIALFESIKPNLDPHQALYGISVGMLNSDIAALTNSGKDCLKR